MSYNATMLQLDHRNARSPECMLMHTCCDQTFRFCQEKDFNPNSNMPLYLPSLHSRYSDDFLDCLDIMHVRTCICSHLCMCMFCVIYNHLCMLTTTEVICTALAQLVAVQCPMSVAGYFITANSTVKSGITRRRFRKYSLSVSRKCSEL